MSELYLHARCHMSSGTYAAYESDTNELRIECAECKSPVVTVELAEINPLRGMECELCASGVEHEH